MKNRATFEPSRYSELAELGRADADLWIYSQRLKGYTIDQITALIALPKTAGGLGLKIGSSTVYRRIQSELGRRVELSDFKRDELRALELDRLDGIMLGALELAGKSHDPDEWGVVSPRDEKNRLVAMQTVLRISESRRKLLGLDAPLQVEAEVTTIDATDAAVLDLVEAVRAADRAAKNRG